MTQNYNNNQINDKNDNDSENNNNYDDNDIKDNVDFCGIVVSQDDVFTSENAFMEYY